MQGRTQLQMGGRACTEAHIKHFVHVRDAGCVETQRLVEHFRDLPSGKGGYEEGETPRVWGGREVTGRCKLRVGEDAAADGRQDTRGEAHLKHVAHVRDAGGVEAQRLVERRRILPSK